LKHFIPFNYPDHAPVFLQPEFFALQNRAGIDNLFRVLRWDVFGYFNQFVLHTAGVLFLKSDLSVVFLSDASMSFE